MTQDAWRRLATLLVVRVDVARSLIDPRIRPTSPFCA